MFREKKVVSKNDKQLPLLLGNPTTINHLSNIKRCNIDVCIAKLLEIQFNSGNPLSASESQFSIFNKKIRPSLKERLKRKDNPIYKSSQLLDDENDTIEAKSDEIEQEVPSTKKYDDLVPTCSLESGIPKLKSLKILERSNDNGKLDPKAKYVCSICKYQAINGGYNNHCNGCTVCDKCIQYNTDNCLGCYYSDFRGGSYNERLLQEQLSKQSMEEHIVSKIDEYLNSLTANKK